MSLVEDVRSQVEKRLRELKPFVEEHEQLNNLIGRLSGSGSTPTRKRRGRPPGSKNRPKAKTASTARRSTARKSSTTRRKTTTRSRRGANTRAAEAQAMVKANPGITISDMAKRMGIKQNYLYRVMPTLAKEKKVKRVGKGWHPA
jgi:ribosomal protein S25